MNFRDFHDLLEVVASPVTNNNISSLDVPHTTELIKIAVQKSFGTLPEGANIQTKTDDGYEKDATVVVRTQKREIEFVITSNDYRLYPKRVVEVDITFTWESSHRPTARSPKDNSWSFSIAQELDVDTMPALKAFKQFLLLLREYPILVTFTAMPPQGSDGLDFTAKNRRASLYARIMHACGYTKKNGAWYPPIMNRLLASHPLFSNAETT